jgi:predicted secreted hydrolase
MSGELEVTEELRKKFAEETADALAREGLKPGTVEVWEDGHRTAGRDDAFEWWYFDAQFDDGSTAVVVFSTKPMTKPSGPLAPGVLIIHKPAGGKRESFTSNPGPAAFSASTDACDVRMGPNWARGDLASYALHAEAEGIAVDLDIRREGPSWRPGAAVTYYNEAKTKYFAWVVAVPYGTVQGTISLRGEAREVKGTVYHDHNWGNASLGSQIDHWYWGRAHLGEFSLIFTMMTTVKIFGHGGIKLPVFFISRGDEILTDDGLPLRLKTSGEEKGPGGHTYPTRLEWRWEAAEGKVLFTLTDPVLLEDLDLSADFPGWARPLIHLVARPYYYDFDAGMELSVDLKGIKETLSGRAIFEKMMLR